MSKQRFQQLVKKPQVSNEISHPLNLRLKSSILTAAQYYKTTEYTVNLSTTVPNQWPRILLDRQ